VDAGIPDARPAPDAMVPDARPAPVVHDWNRCTVDTDCALNSISCSACGRCPGALAAANTTYLEKLRKDCMAVERERERVWAREKARARKRGTKPRPVPRPKCAPCQGYTPEQQASWPTHAVCDRGVCVPASHESTRSNPGDGP